MAAKSGRGSGRSHRSAITGRYVTRAAAARWPSRTVSGSRSSSAGAGGVRHRSASTGRYVGAAAAARWPNQTVTEGK